VREGASVAVIGCGGVGLAVIQGARLAGAARIVAVDVVPEKLALAAQLGATDTVDGSSGQSVAEVRALTDGVDYAFSAITSPAGLVDAVRMCAYGGTATLVGVPPPGRTLDIDLELDLFHPKVAIAVTHGGDTIPQTDFPFLAQAALDGRIAQHAKYLEVKARTSDPADLEELQRGIDKCHDTALDTLKKLLTWVDDCDSIQTTEIAQLAKKRGDLEMNMRNILQIIKLQNEKLAQIKTLKDKERNSRDVRINSLLTLTRLSNFILCRVDGSMDKGLHEHHKHQSLEDSRRRDPNSSHPLRKRRLLQQLSSPMSYE
jgi:hypothetical protein